ncbi:hypothetical protein E1A91_D07G257400v1 [Gossypium mustelinum]|uniref:Uncharacterized protein n=1 Tax=Gossypium mustelinum TaxID=34275 RepID=A0A5D2UC73_GOSMU|nr:hypothetical protein E1A91_D07G257400v1 [Gossypium mustelinum]TYI75185.1 hypothetical protein E1A91_D07G257400v1 [Gossypium mustelinum]TYI75187.1 hypothetical protein E1A91_D07G257400v1 [Gossypium mustelinum]
MGNYFNKEPPPPVVLVPPLFDFPPLAARTRMLESSYNMLFGKLGLKCLFEDYFEEARHFNTIFMLKPIDDPNVDMMATLSGPFNIKPEERIAGNASFRWQNDVDDPHTFMDLFVSNSDPVLRMRSCTYFPRYGFGVFGILPLLLKKRVTAEDYGVMGLRYGSGWLSAGVTVMPFAIKDQLPRSAWLVSKLGRLTFGVQYEPQYGSEDEMKYKNKLNWSCAIGYGVGSGCPLSPSFTFGLELAKSSQGKLGPLSSSLAVAVKSWWKPSFTFSISANRDRISGTTAYGLGLRIENLREASYQRADPNFVMLTPNKEHLAEGTVWKTGNRPMLEADVNAGNFDRLPKELRPQGRIL